MRASLVGLLLLLVAGLSQADGSICAQSCSASENDDVIYEPGKQYRYLYQGEVVSRTRSMHSQESRMSVRSYVLITARTRCDLKMQVVNLAIDDVPNQDSQWFREAVEEYDLHFSYKNGMVSYLCPHEDEDVAATNFKRGILSAIQAKVTNANKPETIVYESDILGECETQYQVTQSGYLTVNKTKHGCRYNNHLPYIPSQHYSGKELSNKGIFQPSGQSCQMYLQDGVWNRVECFEELQAQGNKTTDYSVASFTITTTLILEEGPEEAREPFANNGPQRRRETLRMDLEGALKSADSYRHRYDDSDIFEQITMTMEFLMAAIRSDSGLDEKRPHAFAHLVTLIGQVEKEESFYEIWGIYENDQKSRQYILDASLLCESGPCVKLMTKLAADAPEALPRSRVQMWLASVHFHLDPHHGSVGALMELALNDMAVEKEAVMAASSVVYRLCQQNKYTCKEYAKPLLEYVEDKLDNSCGYGQTHEERLRVKIALKALANSGLRTGISQQRCYMNKLMNPEIRVLALQTYRRVECTDLDLETPWKILEDVDDDVGVRIAAYSSLVRCATETPAFFTRVKNLLEREEVNQVGSYIWTHVRNLAHSPDWNPESRELSNLAHHHTLQAKFNTNAFRTSRNYRYAQFSEAANIGSRAESDIIFTPDSYIPRYESHKIHVDFLENSAEFFELGMDYKGIEQYIERLFGTEGYFENEAIQKALESLRPKRDVSDDKIQEFQMLYDDLKTMNELEDMGEDAAKAGVYFRVFGNEIFYMDNIMKSDPWMFIQKFIREFSMPRSFQIFKQEYATPTLLGFPLRLRANATATLVSEHRGNFRMTSMQEFHMEGQISASATVSMDETWMVDGYGTSSGVRRRSTRSINAEFGGKFSVQDGEVVDIQFDVPNNEIAHLSSSVEVALYQNYKQAWDEREYEGPAEKSEYCLPDETSRIFGFDFCSTNELSLIQTDSEETIPGDIHNAEYTLSKSDSFAFYKFAFRNQRNNFEVLFDTPGSSFDRKVDFTLNFRGNNNARGALRVPGKSYEFEGQYENTDDLKKFGLQYLEDSVLKGEIQFNLPITQDESGFTYRPVFLVDLKNVFNANVDGTLRMDAHAFALEGNLLSSLQTDPLRLKATWERMESQHKIEGNANLGQMFGSLSGSLFLNGEKTMFRVDTEYGMDRQRSNSLAFTFDKSLVIEQGETRHTGYLSMESSLGRTNLELDYDYGAGHARADTNVTVMGTEVTSQVVVKNEGNADERDFQFTVGLTSPQLEMDYLGQAIYKTSNNTFQGELQVNLGPTIRSKAALTYLFEDDPLHVIAGLHFHVNDFIIESIHELDFSKPNVIHITSSDIIGPAVGVCQIEIHHDPTAPFNATIDIHAGYDNRLFGVSASTASDGAWHQFQGSMEAKWLNESYTVHHKAQWEESKKHITFSYGENMLEILLETDPDFTFNVIFQQDSRQDNPDFKFGIGRRTERLKEQSLTTYETYLTSYNDDIYYLMLSELGDRKYSGKLRIMESELDVTGRFLRHERDDLEMKAQAIVTFPSGDTMKPSVTILHTYDGESRQLMISASQDESTIESTLTIVHRDGWFEDDARKVNFTFNSPFDGMRNIELAFEQYSDWSQPNFAEAQWEDLKVRGELQLGDMNNLQAKLLYEDGGTCDSHFHLYHKYEDHRYLTGASLGLTKAHDPWAVEVTTTKVDNSEEERSLDVDLKFQSPMLVTPFEMNGGYKLTSDQLSVDFQAGLESKTEFSFSGVKENVEDTQKLLGTLNFDSPWNEPVFFSVENIYNSEGFNVTADLRTSWEPIQTVRSEFTLSYAVPGETGMHFYLNQQNIQITLEMIHKLSKLGLVQQIHGSVNAMTLSYELDANWDENYVPSNSQGHISVNGLFSHNLEITLAHITEGNRFDTKLSGSWDWHQVQANHVLEYDHALKWTSTLQVALPGDNEVTAQLFLNGENDLSSIESTFYFNSSWTEGFTANLEVHGEVTSREYGLETTYGDTKLFNAIVRSKDSFQWDKADISLELSSSLFDNLNLAFKYDFQLGHLVSLEISYGEDFYLNGKSHLRYKQGFFNQDFEGYDFGFNLKMMEPQLSIKTMFGLGDLYSGEFELSWYEYLLSIKSSIPDNTVFAAVLTYPGDRFETELLYELKTSNIPDFSFRFTRNDTDLFTFKGEFLSVYPNFDTIFTLYYFDESTGIPKNGRFQITADMSHIEDYAFKGLLKLNSDFEGYESYWAEIDAGMDFKHKAKGHLNGQVHLTDWHYKTKMSSLLDLGRDFQIEYNSEYEMNYGDQLLDKKELKLMYSDINDVIEGQVTTKPKIDSPVWSVFIHFNKPKLDFKANIVPGSETKYELSLKITNNALQINARSEREGGSQFTFIRGNIKWNLRKFKKQFTLNLNSDFSAIKKVTGQVVIQQRRGLAANAKLRVNQDDFTGLLRYTGRGQNTGKVMIKIENEIFVPFTSNTNIEFSMKENEVKTDLKMEVNGEKDWAKANFKGSLSESYLRFSLPFEPLSEFDLTVGIETESKYGLKVELTGSLFCFNFDGSLSKFYDVASINTKLDWKCSGDPLYDFNFRYNFENNDVVDISTNLFIQNYGNLFKLEVTGILDIFNQTDLTIITELYPNNYHTSKVSLTEGDEIAFQFHVKDTLSDNTEFLFRSLYSKTLNELEIEVGEVKIITFREEHEFSHPNVKVDASYSNNIFGYSFNAKLTLDGIINSDSGNLEAHLSTDGSFSFVDFTMEYDKDSQGHFSLATSNGNAEGRATYDKENSLYKCEMQSTLHTFANYQLEVVYDKKDDHSKLRIKTVQDDIEFEVQGRLTFAEGSRGLNLEVKVPFEIIQGFELAVEYPMQESSQSHYEVKVGFMIFESKYEIHVDHTHQTSWRSQETKLSLTTPLSMLGTYEISFMYDLASHSSFNFEYFKGKFGLDGAWNITKRKAVIEMVADLSLLDQGEYRLKANLPMIANQKGEIEFSRNQTDLGVVIHLLMGENFKEGELSLKLLPSGANEMTYSLTYVYKKHLTIHGQWDKWNADVTAKFTGKRVPVTSGTFDISTNFEGFEAINGSWNFQYKRKVYSADITINLEQRGAIKFNTSFTNQPKGTSGPWQNIIVMAEFESPFTKYHNLNLECNIPDKNIAFSYQYGNEQFHINLTSTVDEGKAIISLNGNVPINGISTFNMDFGYDFQNAFSTSFKMHVEETILEVNYEADFDWKTGHTRVYWTSPFTNPLDTVLRWSVDQSPVEFEATWKYGSQEVGFNLNLEYSDDSAHFDLKFMSPIEQAFLVNITVMYDFSNYNDIKASAALKINENNFKIESGIMAGNDQTYGFKASGSMQMFEINGSFKLNIVEIVDGFKVELSGQISGFEAILFTLNASMQHLQTVVQYGNNQILVFNLDSNKLGMKFAWENLYLDITSQYKSIGYGYEIECSVQSSEMRPLTIYASYSGEGQYQGNLRILFGDQEYNLRGKLSLRSAGSSLEFHFESSKDRYNPISVNAMYDLADFMEGRMRSEAELVSGSFEWGEMIQFSLKGQRRGKTTKLGLDLTTPFTALPELRLGYEGDLVQKGANINANFTAFAEWSEKISITGLFKFKNNKLDLRWQLTTPYSAFNDLAFNFQHNNNHAEASVVFNREEWKIICDYEFSPTFSVSLTAETPIYGFKIISFDVSAGVQNNKLNAKAKLTWGKINVVEVKIIAEMWYLEIYVNTPWEPLKEASFITSLRTESEELMYTLALKWSSTVADFTFALSPFDLKMVGKYVVDNDEIGTLLFEYHIADEAFELKSMIETPFEFFSLFEVVLHLSFEESTFKVVMPFLYDFSVTLEAKNYWREITTEGSFSASNETTPYSFRISYVVGNENDSFACIVKLDSEINWISVDAQFQNELNVDATFYDGMVQMNLTNPNAGELLFNVDFKPTELVLESLNLIVSAKYGRNLEFLEASAALTYKTKDQEEVKHEMNVQSKVDNNSILSMNFNLESDLLKMPYNLRLKVPFDILESGGKIEVELSNGSAESYKIFFEMYYPGEMAFIDVITVMFPTWTAELSVSLTKSNFQVSFFYPSEETKHTFVLSWPKELSLEKWALQLEFSSPYLEEGDINFIAEFSAQQKYHFALISSLSYGSKSMDMNSKFQYSKRERRVLFEANVNSGWIGDHSTKFSVAWLRNINVNFNLKLLNQQHYVKLQIDREEYTMLFSFKSPWISNEEITITGMVNKDITLQNVMIEGNLETDDNAYKVEGKFESTDEDYMKVYFIMRGNEGELLRVSGLLQFNESKIDLDFNVHSDVVDINTSIVLRYEDSESYRSATIKFRSSLLEYGSFYIYFFNSRTWADEQRLTIELYDLFRFKCKTSLAEEEKEIDISFSGFNWRFWFDFEYEFADEVEFGIRLETPLNDLEIISLTFDWPFASDSEKTVKFYYGWYEDYISFRSSMTSMSLKTRLETPFKGYEEFGIHLDVRNPYTALIVYPTGKAGFDLLSDCQSLSECKFRYSIHLPFEKYEIISLRYVTPFKYHREILDFEIRVGKVGFTFSLIPSSDMFYTQIKNVIRINEYKSESYLKISTLFRKFVVKIHSDFELQDLADVKFFEFVGRYEPSKELLLAAKTDQEDLAKAHLVWGSDKVVAITTPKVYPGYLVLNLETSDKVNDYKVQVGLSRAESSPWELYGFHIHQKELGYGRDLHLSAEAGNQSFSLDGTITLNPFFNDNIYLNDRLVIGLNQKEIGFATYFQTSSNLFEERYMGDLQIILPEQTVHWDTNATHEYGNFNLLSKFKWNELDAEEHPIAFEIDYYDISIYGQDHTLKAVFSHPQIQNLTLQGNLTQELESPLFVAAEFVDENAPERNILFQMNSMPGLENEEHIIQANISQPYSNFAIQFYAEIMESISNRASYNLKYWSNTEQKWEAVDLTTRVDSTELGWNFDAQISKSNTNWGYNYNGSLLYLGDIPTFHITGESKHFMDYWMFESSVNKYLPELEVKLHVGQTQEEPHETGRIRIGLHNPLELGAIVDHERFGVWRQDARAGLRLMNEDLLQFLIEYDPSFDFTDESIAYSLTSPASKISQYWVRDLSYGAFAFQQWASSEVPRALEILFSQDTFRTIQTYEVNQYESVRQYVVSMLSVAYEDLSEVWMQNITPVLDSSYNYTTDMFAALKPYFERTKFNFLESFSQIADFMDIAYVYSHDQIIEDLDKLSFWWAETTHEMAIGFNNMMYQIVRATNAFSTATADGLIYLQDTFGPTFESYQMAFERYGQELDAVFGGQCWSRIQQEVARFSGSLAAFKYMGEQFFQPEEYRRVLRTFRNWVEVQHDHNKAVFEDGMAQLQEAIEESAVFENMLYEYQELQQFITEAYNESFSVAFERRFSEFGPQIMGTADRVVYLLREKYTEFQQYSQDNIILDYLEAVTSSTMDRLFLTWQQWRAQEYQILGNAQRILFSLVDTIKKTVMKTGPSIMDQSIIVEPSVRGKIIYNQYLPVPWNSFLEGPQWFRLANLFEKESPLSESRRILAEGLDDAFSTLEVLTIPGSSLPPFTATATVYGQQITTFDLLHYQFLGSCTYLMAKDFVGGDFEVIGDYIRSETGEIGLHSMRIRAQGADVTLFVDGTYEATNMGSSEVHTEGNYVAFKQGALFVTCNKLSQGCSVTVGGKYFGRLAGLLGNFNYEPSDDSRGPDGSKAVDGEDIANSWAVTSDTCYQANQVRTVGQLSQVSDFNSCHELFLRSSSQLSGCFLTVDPRPYFWHCVRDQSRPDFGNDQRNSPCDAAFAYRVQCANRGLHMNPLEQCPGGRVANVTVEEGVPEGEVPEVQPGVGAPPPQAPRVLGKCDAAGETVTTEWSRTYQAETEGAVDIAFVVEVGNCNKDRNLQLLVKLIKVQLKRAGIQDVRYALVTTNGDNVDVPASLVEEDDFVAQIDSLVLDGAKDERGGVEAVMATARQLKWRPGVARNIVQLPCRACDEGDAVTEALMENDVTYHILTKFKSVINGPNAKKSKAMANKVWGFDAKKVYSPKDAKKFGGNANMRKIMEFPEDSSCMAAAELSGGSVFNINKWTTKSNVLEKKYLGVIGQRLILSSKSPECQECRCIGTADHAAVSCRKCGAEWPVIEEATPEVVGVQVSHQEAQFEQQEGSQEEAGVQEQEEKTGSETIVDDIKKSFKQQYIEDNAALAQVLEDPQEEREEHRGQEESEESEESEEEDYDGDNYDDNYQEYDYSYYSK